MILRSLLAAVALAATLPCAARAQDAPRFSAEGRGGVAVPRGDFGDAADTGPGFEVRVGFGVTEKVAVYTGYNRAVFGIAAPGSLDLTDSGFALGARLALSGSPTVASWVATGFIFHRVELTGRDGSGGAVSVRSDRGVGFELGGGFDIALSPALSVTPGVRYRAHSPELRSGVIGFAGTDVNYFLADLGFRARF